MVIPRHSTRGRGDYRKLMCELGVLVGARRVLDREIGWLDGEEEAQGGPKKEEKEKEKEENGKQAAASDAEGSLERRLAAIKLRQELSCLVVTMNGTPTSDVTLIITISDTLFTSALVQFPPHSD